MSDWSRVAQGVVGMCAWALLLGACNDAEDRVADEQREALRFEVHGTLCGRGVSYEAPAGTKLTVIATPSGRVQALVIADGPLFRFRDPQAVARYAEEHDVFATIALEEPARLSTGELGAVSSAAIGARDFGSSELSPLGVPQLDIAEYEPGKLIAGTVTASASWFSALYPEGERECLDGELTLSFRGAYELWDGQDDCFSPSQNFERIASELILGCACEAEVEEAACVSVCEDPSQASGANATCDGQSIALFCVGEQWHWGYDGPCAITGE